MSFRPYKPRVYASTKDVVGRLVEQSGGVKRAAHLIERSATQVYAYLDPEEPSQITFDQARRLTTPDSPAAAQDLAALAGGFFVPAGLSDCSIADLGAQAAQAFGEMTGALMRALADNRITADEQSRLRQNLDAAIVALVDTRNRLMAETPPE